MPGLVIKLDGDNCWPDLRAQVEAGSPPVLSRDLEVALLPGGMQSGKASVMLRINLPDGGVVLAETSFELLRTAVRACEGRLEYLEAQATTQRQ